LTSEFTREAADAKLILGTLEGYVNDYKVEALDCLIATKKAEVDSFFRKHFHAIDGSLT
jgi:hypothetical protein